MPELGTYGSVRGALSNERPYRDQMGIPFTDLRGDGSVRGWTAQNILSVGSITHGRSRRWTSGSAATRDAGSISGASVGRMVLPALTAE